MSVEKVCVMYDSERLIGVALIAEGDRFVILTSGALHEDAPVHV